MQLWLCIVSGGGAYRLWYESTEITARSEHDNIGDPSNSALTQAYRISMQSP